jgi:hypothetical protein
MDKRTMMMAGVVLVAMGLLWTGQGLGYIGGSFMTGSTTWAIIGPITALAGALLVWRARSTNQPK